MGLAVFLPDVGKGPFLKDEAVLLDPTGRVVWTYEKTHLVPFGEQGLYRPGRWQGAASREPVWAAGRCDLLRC